MDDSEKEYQLHAVSGDLLKDLSGSAAIDRIRALLSDWLRIENMVVLLGAGCSISRGGVALAGLQEHVLDTVLDLGSDLPEIGESIDLVRARKDQSDDSSASFETWLSSIATAQHSLSASGSPFESVGANLGSGDTRLGATELSSLMTTISKIVASRCSLTLPPLTASGPYGHHALIAKLVARDPTLGRAHVFTTNYDLLLESAADDLRVLYSTGFIGSVEPKFDSSAYALDLYYPGEVAEGRVQRFDKFFHLYKLHGSIDWRRKSPSELIRTDSRSLPNWTDWKAWERGERLRFLLGGSTGDSEEAVAILPTESKYLQSIGMPYAHLFRALDAHLKAPQTFFLVIGYGFADEHINRIIDEALTNPGLVVLIVDPTPPPQLTERLERYQMSGERAFLLTGTNPADHGPPQLATFDDFAVNLMPHVRWLEDFLKLRKVEKVVREQPRETDSAEGDSG